MEQVAVGKVDDDTLSSLAGRIATIDNNIDKEDQQKVVEMTGKTLSNIANDILNTIDYDKTESMTEDQILDIKDEAVNHSLNLRSEGLCLNSKTNQNFILMN